MILLIGMVIALTIGTVICNTPTERWTHFKLMIQRDWDTFRKDEKDTNENGKR